jgi:tripartite-type tricarboxylate transporter receptor subunit TctC
MAAGGPTDVLMRAIGQKLQAIWGQSVVIDNKPGANEVVAAQLASKAPADGYTLFFSTEAPLTQNQFLYKSLGYNPEKDFAPVMHLISSPLALVVNNNLPVKTSEEYIALAKSRGASQPISYGTAGAGGVLHLPMAMLVKQNGLSMTHVPYKGVAPILNDMISGQVDSAWMAVAGAAPYVNEGKIKALVVDAPTRVKALPQVPIFKETRIVPVQADFIFAMTVPVGVPAEIVDKLNASLRTVLQDKDFIEKFIQPMGYVTIASSPKEFSDYLINDRVRQAERIKASGAEMD